MSPIVTTTANPLREGLRSPRVPEPAMMVIFGGSGDLAKRKVMPSLYRLDARGRLPDRFAIVAFARSKRTREDYAALVRSALDEFLNEPIDDTVWKRFTDRLYYVASGFDDPSGYKDLAEVLPRLHEERRTEENTVFYLASPPSYFPDIVKGISDSGLARCCEVLKGWTRVIIEKPFGRDLQSAVALNDLLLSIFPEEDIYRIDHYLGKETVQNILVFRFANSIFEPVWNRRYVDHVQITASETVGIEGRADYYEETGALRDMVQNHMLQLISMVAMEPPTSTEAEAIRDEKIRVLRSIRQIRPDEIGDHVVRGQYGAGLEAGKLVPAYREEPGVAPDSMVETYLAAKFYIDNWRWQDVPFYVRTGKRLTRKKTEIAIAFRQVPHGIFGSAPSMEPGANALLIRIAPDEGITLRIQTKPPGPDIRSRPVNLDFRYLPTFGVVPSEAYERLLTDCMLGVQTLYARRDAVEAQWRAVTPIIDGWRILPPAKFPNYEAGSLGPAAARELIERDGRKWRRM